MIPMTLGHAAQAMNGRLIGAESDVWIANLSTDTRTLRAGELFFAIAGPRFDGHDYTTHAVSRGACACVVAAGREQAMSGPVIVVDDPVAALGRLAGVHRKRCRAQVIAVTGSNGKTTTKSMLAHVLGTWKRCAAAARSFNNQIGVPLTLLSCTQDDDLLVVEIGTNAPGEVAALARLVEPDIGVVTSIGDAHLEGLGGRAGVCREKMSLVDHIRSGGDAVIERNAYQQARKLPRRADLRWRTYGDDSAADVRVTNIATDLRGTEATIGGARIRVAAPGRHNAINAAGVFAVCRQLGMDAEAITAALATFQLPDMRLKVIELDGMTLIEDCYNANPSSMAVAIELLAEQRPGRRVLVAGDMAELGTSSADLHGAVGRMAADLGIDLVVSVGKLARGITDAAETARTLHYGDAESAAGALGEHLLPGDTVLIKGSRSARLERICAGLCQECATPA